MGLKTNSSWKTLLYRMMSRSYVVIDSNKGEYWEASYTCAVGIGGGKQEDVRKGTGGFTAVMLTNLDCVSKDLQPSYRHSQYHTLGEAGKRKIDKRK